MEGNDQMVQLPNRFHGEGLRLNAKNSVCRLGFQGSKSMLMVLRSRGLGYHPPGSTKNSCHLETESIFHVIGCGHCTGWSQCLRNPIEKNNNPEPYVTADLRRKHLLAKPCPPHCVPKNASPRCGDGGGSSLDTEQLGQKPNRTR